MGTKHSSRNHEIIFRGRDWDTGRWVFGSPITLYVKRRPVMYIVWWEQQSGLTSFVPGLQGRRVVPSTVGQYTGYRDRDGEDLYDGDVAEVRCGDGSLQIGVIAFKKGAFLIGDVPMENFRNREDSPRVRAFHRIGVVHPSRQVQEQEDAEAMASAMHREDVDEEAAKVKARWRQRNRYRRKPVVPYIIEDPDDPVPVDVPFAMPKLKDKRCEEMKVYDEARENREEVVRYRHGD